MISSPLLPTKRVKETNMDEMKRDWGYQHGGKSLFSDTPALEYSDSALANSDPVPRCLNEALKLGGGRL